MFNIIINWIGFVALGLLGAFIGTFLVNYLTSFEYNLEEKTIQYQDICVGDSIQELTLERSVRPIDGFNADIYGELFRLNDKGRWVETEIKRSVNVYYQPEKEEFDIEISWRSPGPDGSIQKHVFETPGRYGVSDTITIYPYLLISKKQYTPPQELQFNVIECI